MEQTFEDLNIENLEQRLTKGNIQKAIRYMTQCIDGLQFEGALINMTTRDYPGKPISNSVLIHELTETEEFEKLGHDFSSRKLESADYKQRLKVRAKKNKMYRKVREPHLIATFVQYQYLAAVSRNRGYNLSPGTILRFSPITTNQEVENAVKWSPNLVYNFEEANQAVNFVLNLLKAEPSYGKIFLEAFEKGSIKSGVYLYETYAGRVRRVLDKSSN